MSLFRDGVDAGTKRYGTLKNAFKVFLEVTTPNFGTRTSYLKDANGKEKEFATEAEAEAAAREYNRDRPASWRGGASVVTNSSRKNEGPSAQQTWDLASRGERDAVLREMNIAMPEKYRGQKFADLPPDVQKAFVDNQRRIFGNDRHFDAKKLAELRPCPRCQTDVRLVDTTTGLCKPCFDVMSKEEGAAQ